MLEPPGSQLVFQQVISDTSTSGSIFSDPRYNDWLALGCDLKVFVVAERISGTGTLAVHLEDTADEQLDWLLSPGGQATAGYAVSTPLSTTGVVVSGVDLDSLRGRPALGFRRLGVDVTFDAPPGSARVRVWAVARNGYRTFHRLLIAKRIEGSGLVYTQYETSAGLAGADRLVIAIQPEEVSSGTSSLAVQMEESPNGQVWRDVPGAQWSGSIVSGQLVTATMLSDTVPPSGFIRFRLQLAGASPAATVRLWATGRDVHPG